jgi:cell division protein FtsX
MFGRILINTRKHILRSGWVGWASVFVMTLAFLVASIFGGLALVANLYVNYIESKSNMLVFFDVGMDQDVIERLRAKWEEEENISEIVFLSEEEAFDFYAAYTSRVVPEQYQVLTRFDEKKLPSSLEIKISSLNNIGEVQATLQQDINEELQKLVILELEEEEEVPVVEEGIEEGETPIEEVIEEPEEIEDGIRYKYSDEVNEPPINLIVDSENLEILKEVFFNVRIAGIGALSLLFVFVSIFIFMTVEFRLYNQKDEIGVMQLVGGSLFFIRAPYILEGGFYGSMGALFSSGVIGAGLATIFVFNEDSTLTRYIYDNFGQLPWPQIETIEWAGIIAALAMVGFLLGAVSSYFSIRRYIR